MNDPECEDKEHKTVKDGLFEDNCMKCGQMVLYADDCTATVEGKVINEINEKLNKAMGRIKLHLDANRLKLNPQTNS